MNEVFSSKQETTQPVGASADFKRGEINAQLILSSDTFYPHNFSPEKFYDSPNQMVNKEMINLVGEDSEDDMVQQMSSIKQAHPKVHSPTASSQDMNASGLFVSSFAQEQGRSASKLSMDIKVEINQKSRHDTQEKQQDSIKIEEFYDFSANRSGKKADGASNQNDKSGTSASKSRLTKQA